MIVVDAQTPGGKQARFVCREDTSDADLVRAVVGDDEYGLAALRLAGWALDVGAHIGTVTVALALDHPRLQVIAVEPVPESRDVLRQNVALNGLADRVTIDERAAAAPDRRDPVAVAYGHDGPHRYVGNLRESGLVAVHAPAVSLERLLDAHAVTEAALLKLDCEGCEWGFLRDPAVARIREVVGEYHGDPEQLWPLLQPTHDVQLDAERFLFRAVRR